MKLISTSLLTAAAIMFMGTNANANLLFDIYGGASVGMGGTTIFIDDEHPGFSATSYGALVGVDLPLFRIEGGYGIQPRWSDVVRKGPMTARVTRVIEPEEYDQMTNEELFDIIQKELWVDEAAVTGTYTHPNTAEYLERAIYVCPFCGLAEHESHGDTITCKSCGKQVKYLPTKELKGVDFDFPFPFVAQWYDYQEEFVNGLDLTAMTEEPLFHDTASLSEVILYDRKVKLQDQVFLTLYGDRLDLDGTVYSFDEISYVTVLGRNKLNLYIGDKVYQCKGSKRFNALKYVNFFHKYKNTKSGDTNGTFLGL